MTKTKKWIIAIAILLFILLVARRVHAQVQESRAIDAQKQALEARIRLIEGMTVVELIDYLAPENASKLKPLGNCESSLDQSRINYDDGATGSHSYGLFQFKIDTFNEIAEEMGEALDIESAYDQIRAADHALSKRQYTKWKNCAIKIGLL